MLKIEEDGGDSLPFEHKEEILTVRKSEDLLISIIIVIVLYCIEGVVIAAQYTAPFSRSIVLPRI